MLYFNKKSLLNEQLSVKEITPLGFNLCSGNISKEECTHLSCTHISSGPRVSGLQGPRVGAGSRRKSNTAMNRSSHFVDSVLSSLRVIRKSDCAVGKWVGGDQG